MENELITRIKPQFYPSSVLYSNKDIFLNIKSIFLLIVWLLGLGIIFFGVIKDNGSGVSEKVWIFIFSNIVILGSLIFSFLQQKEQEYKNTGYKVYPDKLVIERDDVQQTLETKYINDIVITRTEFQKNNNISSIKFITDKSMNIPDFSFEDIEDAAAVYDIVKPYIVKKEYTDVKDNNIIMVIKPQLKPVLLFFNTKASNNVFMNILHKILCVGFLAVSLYYITKSFSTINPELSAKFLIIAAVVLFVILLVTSELSSKRELECTSYTIYKDKIQIDRMEIDRLGAPNLKKEIVNFSDIENIEYLQSSVQKKYNVGSIHIKTKNIKDIMNIASTFCLVNIENPAFICSKIRQLKEDLEKNNV